MVLHHERTGLLQRQGQAVQVDGQGQGVGIVGRGCPTLPGCPRQEEVGRRALVQHIQFHRHRPGGVPVRNPRRDDHVSIRHPRKQLLYRRRRFGRVHVVEDQEPAGVTLQPPDRRRHLHLLFPRVALVQVQDLRPTQPSQTAAKTLRAVGRHKEERSVLVLEPPAILDRQPRLADPTQPVDRLHGRDHRRMSGFRHQRFAQSSDERIPPLEQIAK